MNGVKNAFAIFGLSKFGYRMALSLFEGGSTVIAVDINERKVQKISESVSNAVCADLMDWDVMDHIGAFDVDVAIIGLRHSFDAEVLLTNHLKKHTDVAKIIAQVDTDEKGEALRLMGADLIVFPEKDMADRVVKQLTMSSDLVDLISLSPNAAIIEMLAPDTFIGRSLIQLKIRSKHNVHVVGIKHHDKEREDVIIAPSPDAKFLPADTMLLLGNTENLKKFNEDMQRT